MAAQEGDNVLIKGFGVRAITDGGNNLVSVNPNTTASANELYF